MCFSENELTAIVRMAKAMAAADGKIDAKELILIAGELASFASGIDGSRILDSSDNMSADEALRILNRLTPEEKKYVCGYLAAISTADGNVDDKEIAVWKLVSTLANFPTMTFQQALSFWRNN